MSSKDFPHIKPKDVVEIFHPDVEGSRVLLQVHSIKDEMQTKGKALLVSSKSVCNLLLLHLGLQILSV